MTHHIIAGLQILPKGGAKAGESEKKALAVIEQSGLPFKQENFEVVIEGNFDQVMRVIEAIQLASFNAGAEEIMINAHFYFKNGKDVKLR